MFNRGIADILCSIEHSTITISGTS